MVGVYGVVSYTVGQRRHDYGVGITFGARRADVLRLVLREGLGWAALGILARVGLALAACLVPAFGAARTDPIRALHYE